MKNLSNLRKIFNFTQKELSTKIGIEEKTLANYENKDTIPILSTLIKLVDFYGISLDYMILNDDCYYPKNLKLLSLAKKLDALTKAEARNSIEYNAKSFLAEKINEKISIQFDDIHIVLTNNFNLNLKELRTLQNLKQRELAESINVSRSVLSKYEERNYPPLEKLVKLSETLKVSCHALATGKGLTFNFKDGYFGEIMLLADRFLSLEQQKVLITLMEAILQNQPVSS